MKKDLTEDKKKGEDFKDRIRVGQGNKARSQRVLGSMFFAKVCVSRELHVGQQRVLRGREVTNEDK